MGGLFDGDVALEGERVLLVVLNGGDGSVEPDIEQAVAAAVRCGKPVRAVVSESARVPAFFSQVDDLIVRYFLPEDFASFQRALGELCWAHHGYPAVLRPDFTGEDRSPP